jgi:16S rRNA (guanine966-N2)-methyltransferase
MRVISGEYKGRHLQAAKNLSIRPTTDRVKEYIFNILQDFQHDKIISDIFAGSGSLGIEALSRGAIKAVFVEKNCSSIRVLLKNLEHLGIGEQSTKVIHTSAEEYVSKNHSEIDLYFLDPPFVFPELQKLIDSLTCSDYFIVGNLVVLEHEISNPINFDSDYYKILKQKKMGRSLISFIEKRISQ